MPADLSASHSTPDFKLWRATEFVHNIVFPAHNAYLHELIHNKNLLTVELSNDRGLKCLFTGFQGIISDTLVVCNYRFLSVLPVLKRPSYLPGIKIATIQVVLFVFQ